ncbi:hypothetical protein GCM10009612_38170 [Streptomyces beijiangensis]
MPEPAPQRQSVYEVQAWLSTSEGFPVPGLPGRAAEVAGVAAEAGAADPAAVAAAAASAAARTDLRGVELVTVMDPQSDADGAASAEQWGNYRGFRPTSASDSSRVLSPILVWTTGVTCGGSDASLG